MLKIFLGSYTLKIPHQINFFLQRILYCTLVTDTSKLSNMLMLIKIWSSHTSYSQSYSYFAINLFYIKVKERTLSFMHQKRKKERIFPTFTCVNNIKSRKCKKTNISKTNTNHGDKRNEYDYINIVMVPIRQF